MNSAILQKQLFADVLQKRCFEKFTGKQLCWSLFFKKVAGLRTPTQVFSCEFCEIFKNTFFTEHLHWLILILPQIVSCACQITPQTENFSLKRKQNLSHWEMDSFTVIVLAILGNMEVNVGNEVPENYRSTSFS